MVRAQLKNIAALTLGVAAAVMLTACGSDGSGGGQEPGDAVRASLAAAKQATSFRLVGSGTDSGKPLQFDIHFGSNGSDGSVTMSGSKIALKVVGRFVYFQAPEAFYRAQGGGEASTALVGKWVKVAKDSQQGAGFSQLSDSQALIKSFSGSLTDSDAAGLKRLGSGTVDGVASTRYGDDGGSIDIAASGKPYPLKLVSKDKGDGGMLTFSQWDVPFAVTLPPAAQTVTPS